MGDRHHHHHALYVLVAAMWLVPDRRIEKPIVQVNI